MASIRVEVVVAFAERAEVSSLTLPAGTTAAQAVEACGLLRRCPEAAGGPLGVFGKVVPGTRPLADGDRVEVYRQLAEDPKEARRRRAKRVR